MTFVSYAQNFEDVLLWRAFRDVGRGFYIDVGAAHPDIDSVTRAFYDRGWTGVNIEPVPEFHARLTASRPRDVNLRVVAGAALSEGTVYVVAGTGLSTVDAALADQHRAQALDVRAQHVAVETLAQICRRFAPTDIHFLKIDVEGAERAVLAGADFVAFRPWIVLVEATAPGSTVQTHDEWEPILLDANYVFLWFDGLNRFYAAAERAASLSPHFRVPVCVFDDFLRAADTEWTRRITQAESQAADLLERGMAAEAEVATAEAHARAAEQRALSAEQRAIAAEGRAERAEPRASGAERRADVAEHRLQQTEARLAEQASETQRLLATLDAARDDAAALRRSTSWRLTAPLRSLGALRAARPRDRVLPQATPPAPPPVRPAARPALARPLQAPTRDMAPAPAPLPTEIGPCAVPPVAARATRTVHQFHSGSAVGDAITNAMLLIRSQLRARGYRSEIYVEHLDPALGGEVRSIEEMPQTADHVLILHLSMGFDAYDRVIASPSPKVLMYHNITPATLFADQPGVAHYAQLGRQQLAGLPDRVAACLADSEYNAIELRSLGFDDPQACTLLFDLDRLRGQFAGAASRPDADPFTLLFVGRVTGAKGQLDLVEAFAVFRTIHTGASRLVLVGREDGIGEDYAREVRARVEALGLDEHVVLAGLVSDDALRRQYAASDLYVSLSRHEGFGVPLVEAACGGLPVLAWPAGAVPYTLGGAGLLETREPHGVAARLAELAGDPSARAALAQAQHDALSRFALPAQLDTLFSALARAGAAPPGRAEARSLLARNLRFTVAGHVSRSYSLAAVNRTLARTLDRARPGRVRLMPIEGEPTAELGEVPADERAAMQALADRPPHESGPVVVISQHYPVHVPEDRGDALLAYVFWEESLLPPAMVATLNAAFRAVLAPSRFVARALIDSGVAVPVHVVGFAPDLGRFMAQTPRTSSGANRATRFLHVSSAFPRKGIDVLLAAYARAFRAGDPVRLVIKTFPNPHNDAAARIDALRRADPQAPAIELIDRDLAPGEMAGLFRDADAIVLPTRGEGFNIPAAEAMAAGVPLIVTGHGGHMDFCDAARARLVGFSLAASRSHLAGALSLWAEPDTEDLAAALREAHDDPAPGLARAERARAAATAFDADAFGRRVEAACLETLLAPPRRPMRLCVVSSWGVRCGVAEYAAALVEAMVYADAGLEVVVLADMRATGASQTGHLRVRPAWTLGTPDAEALHRAIAAEDADAVHIQHQPALIAWSRLGRLLTVLAGTVRVVAVTLHNTADLLDIAAGERDAAIAGLRAASRVIVHSLADIERLRGLGLVDVVLVPQGAPEPLYPKAERTLVGNDVVTIGSCGFLLPGKGIPTLVEAVGRLRADWPRARLRLMTADYGSEASGAEAARVMEAARAANLEGSVQLERDFLPLHETRWRLGACDLIVLPYQPSKEGSSAALRMALGAGPCVAVTPIGLFDEAGDAVWRLPGTGAAAMAEGLNQILSDQDARANTRRLAQRWLADRSWQAVGQRTLGMLHGLAASPSADPDA